MDRSKSSRLANKLLFKESSERRNRDRTTTSKTNPKKRKLSDMLSTPWSKEEMQCFYEAYCKYGKEWEKVGAAVGSRSVDTVEALYIMNREYLSRPNSITSAAGLISRMTYRYERRYLLDGVKSKRESRQAIQTSNKAQKCSCSKLQLGMHKGSKMSHPDHLHAHSKPPTPGRLSSSRKNISGDLYDERWPRAVGKRTPRFPVPSCLDKCERDNNLSPNEHSLKSTTDASASEDTHVAAPLVLGASQGGGQQQVHQNSGGLQSPWQDAFEIFSPDEMLALDALVELPANIQWPNLYDDAANSGKNESKIIDKSRGYTVDAQAEDINRESNGTKNDPCLYECTSFQARKKSKKALTAKNNPKAATCALPLLVETEEVYVEEGGTSHGNCAVLQGNQNHTSECLSCDSDHGIASLNVSGSIPEDSTVGSHNKPIRSKRKIKWQKQKPELKSTNNIKDDFSVSACEGMADVKEKISHCLSSDLLRRWCAYEWFYSTIDYPWFARNEFSEYLHYAGFIHLHRLTRSEWCIIRRSLGSPRRFCEEFLLGERTKLEQYRESTRTYYAETQADTRDGPSRDFAQPLSVGQHVIARHPLTRELHNGKVVVVDRDHYRIQFDSPDLGSELVMDIDCMATNWLENLPEDLKKLAAYSYDLCNKLKMEDIVHRASLLPSCAHLFNMSKEQFQVEGASSNVAVASTRQETDALLRKINHMEKEQARKQEEGETVQSTLHGISLHGTFDDCSDSPEFQLMVGSSQARSQSNNHPHNHELGAGVAQFIKSSMLKARMMVDVTVQEISNLENGTDTLIWNEDCLDSEEDQHATTTYHKLDKSDTQSTIHNLTAPHLSISCALEAARAQTCPKKQISAKSPQVPSELISACVSTFLMIQSCTERHFPPLEIIQALDHAFAMLRPVCSENLPIYKEIETCIGIIKTQILSLIPTPSSSHPAKVSV